MVKYASNNNDTKKTGAFFKRSTFLDVLFCFPTPEDALFLRTHFDFG